MLDTSKTRDKKIKYFVLPEEDTTTPKTRRDRSAVIRAHKLANAINQCDVKAIFQNYKATFEQLRALSRNRYKIPPEFFIRDGKMQYIRLGTYETRTGIIEHPDFKLAGLNLDSGRRFKRESIIMDIEGKFYHHRRQAIAVTEVGWWQPLDLDQIEKAGFAEQLDVFWLKNIRVRVSEFCLFKDVDLITAQEILSITNEEITRAIIARVGYDRVKEILDVRVLNRDDKGSEVLEIWNPTQNRDRRNEHLYYVKVIDSSTNEIYLLPVPRIGWGRTSFREMTVQRCLAWTFGFGNAEDYHPAIET